MPAPLFSWLDRRDAGLLAHPTCLPGSGGVGTLGAAARQLVDFIAASGMRYWQICPLGPTGFGDSPYQCFSAFAGNPYLIDLEALLPVGLLRPDELAPLRELAAGRVDFGGLYRRHGPILRLAHRRFRERGLAYLPNYGDFAEFCQEQSSWLRPYALFMALKGRFNGAGWDSWEDAYRDFAGAAQTPLARELEEAVAVESFKQYLFFGQWSQLRAHARRRGVEVIGDIPIFVAGDSADVWANPDLFLLDKRRRPTAVAGVPPDYFSPDGQLWGNPLYQWKAHRVEGYRWWMARLGSNFALYDAVRLDHFRAFHDFWKIPASAPTAETGKWAKGPGLAFFRRLLEVFPKARIIAEDLGDINEGVTGLLAATGLPGMAVLQFAFGSGADNAYLPHNVAPNTVLYPGTHDNDTARGWYESATEPERDHLRRYLRVSGEDIAWDFLRAAYASPARVAVVPIQDLLGLGSEGRFNQPGEPAGNWTWRLREGQLEHLHAEASGYLLELARLYGRETPAAAAN